jgi:quinoprotein glucose dehydrogenase
MNAQFRLGRKENAQALALFARNEMAPEALRVEALELLALWAKPPGRDHIVGLWRPLPPRDGDVAAHELDSVLPRIETNAPAVVRVAARKAVTALALKPGEAVVPTLSPEELTKLSRKLEEGATAEKQSALAALASVNDDGATKLLSAWLDRLLAGQVVKELQLDVLDAVQKSQSLVTSAATKEKVAQYEAVRDSRDPLAKWRECLYGGDVEDGKAIFTERQDAACLRCHKINGEGGEAGPELTGIGQRQTRESILESILFPNANISPGFETLLVSMKNGSSVAGVVKSENDTQLILHSPEDGLLTIKKADIQKRDRGLSAMPEGAAEILSKRDLRNLIAFLATTQSVFRARP